MLRNQIFKFFNNNKIKQIGASIHIRIINYLKIIFKIIIYFTQFYYMQGNIRKSQGNKLIAVIGDQDTVTGFLLTGIGERNIKGQTNYLIVDQKTQQPAIQLSFKRFLKDPAIAVILLTQQISQKYLKQLVQSHEGISPVILQIPSKQMPYDPKKDIVMQRAYRLLYGADIA